MRSGEGYSLPSILRFQDYQFQVALNTGTWRWTTRVDVSQASATASIRDIISPHGILRDSIPIPGEVVQEMSDSIQQVQASYTPSILLTGLNGTSGLDFVVDEGRGISPAKTVQITNNGILGSLLAATVTSSAPYVHPMPANVSGLVSNATGSFDVSVDSRNLLAIGSYQAELSVQSGSATNSPVSIPINITVRPKATISLSSNTVTFNAVRPLTGDFTPIPSQAFNLVNSGPPSSVLDYQIRKLKGVPWLVSVNPFYGSLNGNTQQAITLVVAPAAGMGVGVYTETLRITGYSSNSVLDVAVTLNVT